MLPLAQKPRTGRITIVVGRHVSEATMSDARRPTIRRPGRRARDLEVPPTLPVLPLKETVVFPQSMTPLAIGQERSIKLVDDVVSGDRMLALVTVKDEEVEAPGWDDLYEVGTAAVVHKLIRVPDGTLRILVQGIRRIKLDKRVSDDPYLVGDFSEIPDELEETKELEALTRNVQNLFGRIIAARPLPPRGAAARGRERRRPGRALRTLSPRRCA